MATARFWMLTIPGADWSPPTTLPSGVSYLKGQQELGSGGYLHWQLVVRTKSPVRMTGVKALFCATAHCEKTRSEAALDYVWKEDTRVEGTQFVLGALRPSGSQINWEDVGAKAKAGHFSEIPLEVMCRHTGNLIKMHSLFARPEPRPGVTVKVYWGLTGCGKSHRAFQEAQAAGGPVYWKTPTTKWWDGYRGETDVIIDEFDGQIGIVHLLRWLDWYPTTVEIKGGATPLKAVNFWMTSNVNPLHWFPLVPVAQQDALMRRITVVEEMNTPYVA